MSEIYYALIDNKGYFINSCFTGKDDDKKFTFSKDKVRSFKTIKSFLTYTDFNEQDCKLAIFWHITGTEDYELSAENCQEIDKKYNRKVIFKVGKSESGCALNEAKRQPWFDIVGSGSDILSYFIDNKWDIEECIKNLPKIKAVEKLNLILALFLPLDIDMQALADVRITDTKKYLKEMLCDVEEGFFLNKFYEVKKLIEDIPDGDNKNKLKAILYIDEEENSYIYKFLKLLEDKKKKCAGLKEEDVQEVISYFNNKVYKTLHDWYWKFTKSTQFE